MKTKQMISVLICMCCTFFLFISCSKDLDVLEPADKGGVTEIQLKNGMLVFPNSESVSNVLSSKESLRMNQFVEPFTSQKDIMDEIVKAETEHYDRVDSLKEEELEKVDVHSRLYYECLDQGIIRKVYYDDGSSSYDLNLSAPLYAKILNREGYFAVGDTIYQITSRYKKIWVGGDVDNYKLLDNYTETNETENVYVIDYMDKSSQEINSGLSRTDFPILIRDQNVGMYVSPLQDYTGTLLRFVCIFYDKTTPIFARKSYLRDTYGRLVCQEQRTVGKDKVWSYVTQIFDYDFMVYIMKDGVEVDFGGVGTTTGYNEYFAIYTMYQMVATGRDAQEFDGEYYQISRFNCFFHYVKLFGGVEVYVKPGISMVHSEGGATPFRYSYPYHGVVSGIGWLTEVLPE